MTEKYLRELLEELIEESRKFERFLIAQETANAEIRRIKDKIVDGTVGEET